MENVMPPDILNYLRSQDLCVFAIEMMDGSPHAATVHFANSEYPFLFFFETDQTYRKSEALFGRPISRASIVIGVDGVNKRTLQIDGEARLLKDEEKESFKKVYYGKFPKKAEKPASPDPVFFMFTPTWWRFTDYMDPAGKRILASDAYFNFNSGHK
jgi:uncharacterized protein YhbP (UPF0306 family)